MREPAADHEVLELAHLGQDLAMTARVVVEARPPALRHHALLDREVLRERLPEEAAPTSSVSRVARADRRSELHEAPVDLPVRLVEQRESGDDDSHCLPDAP